MADILLLEPGYSNKYPPIGLMKISYFHKYIHHDYVRFAKGKLSDTFNGKKWDRVYVTTLFTFEWRKTKEAIEYALSVAKDPTQVYTGGILATLMPELIAENFPTVKNNPGLLDKKGTLGLEYEECIDRLTLDYGILEDIADEYVYPAHDAYFTYMTRGCGMKCAFCAVQTLEPEYYPYISITDTIRKVDEQFGPKKDLLLMDNNVLRSPKFDEIIDEIKALGFAKGATYINPKTGKRVQRFVDFNQGLDAFLLTPPKAKRLGELAIRPARIAFDHIEDAREYKTAIRLCAQNGITHMSNYLLYNGVDFTGKGHSYYADTPEDLYKRMHISMDLQEELIESTGHKVAIFSFPMRYIPLEDIKRGFVGTNWTPKYLRALQRMLIPTQGKGVSSRSFFEADFGKTPGEFVRALAMPESHLGWRGDFIPRKNETPGEIKARKVLWQQNQLYLNEWNRLFDLLGDSKDAFLSAIKDNIITVDTFISLSELTHKKLIIHYFTNTTLLKAFSIESEVDRLIFIEYITNEFPLIYQILIQYITQSKIPYSSLKGICKVMEKKAVTDILSFLDYEAENVPFVIHNLIRIQTVTQKYLFDFEVIKCFFMYSKYGILSRKEKNKIIQAIKNLDERMTRELLLKHYEAFKKVVLKNAVAGEAGAEYILNEIEKQLANVYRQLSLFDS
nr:hypothetical protein [uncultured Blautia sp.]